MSWQQHPMTAWRGNIRNSQTTVWAAKNTSDRFQTQKLRIKKPITYFSNFALSLWRFVGEEQPRLCLTLKNEHITEERYLRKSGALEIMFSKSANESLLSPSRSASSMALSHTSVTSSGVSSPLVSLFRVFSRSSLQMKLSLLKSGPDPQRDDSVLGCHKNLNLFYE